MIPDDTKALTGQQNPITAHEQIMVGVAASIKQKAAHDLESEGEGVCALEWLPLDEALRREWSTDAHFGTYRSEPFDANTPRLVKHLLPRIREAGADVVTQLLVLDYDNPGKVRTTRESHKEFRARLDAVAADGFEPAASWHHLYTTMNGARVIWILTKAIPVDEAEPMHRWLVQEFARRGLRFDPACSDWTRLFRLPRVIRDGRPTWTS